LAKDLSIEPALLATRADIEAFLRGETDNRLTRGWRTEVVGKPLKDLVEGRVALAFDQRNGLVLEPRDSARA
jgi:ribonuclease D